MNEPTIVFTIGYPPHDGDHDSKEKPSLRAKLHEYWARYSNWYKISPVDTIQSYYGEEVGLYFAFMTLYTTSLAIFSIVGIIGILFGISTLQNSIQDGYISKGYRKLFACVLRDPFVFAICSSSAKIRDPFVFEICSPTRSVRYRSSSGSLIK